jgi:hypothetical protein
MPRELLEPHKGDKRYVRRDQPVASLDREVKTRTENISEQSVG